MFKQNNSNNKLLFQSCFSSSDKTVKIWDLNTHECVHTFTDHTDQVWACKYNYDGSRLVSVSDDCSIIIYECQV
jgi:WD repeat-containing protein 61